MLSSCGTYLHNARLEADTKAIKDDIGKMSAPAYLASQQQALAGFAKAEDQAVAERLIASRDYSLLNVIKPPANMRDTRTPGQILADMIAENTKDVIGMPVLSREANHLAQTYPAVAATADEAIATLRRRALAAGKDYSASGGKAPADCKTAVAKPDGAAAEAGGLPIKYAFLIMACQGIQGQEKLKDCSEGGMAGALVEVCVRIADGRGKADAAARKAKLDQAMDALKKAGEAMRPAALQPQVDTWIKQAHDTLDSNLLGDDAKYAEVLEMLGNVFQADLGGVLDDLAAVRDGKEFKAAQASLLDALKIIDAITVITTPDGDPIDEPSALLIGIAKVKHELNMVQIDVELDNRTRDVAGQQAVALRTALALLARARNALCGADPETCPANPTDQAIAQAIGHYTRAINTGMIAYRVLQFREIQLQRDLIVERAALTETDYRALIQPAIDQIAQYGAGGIDPAILGPFLASLPVTGAILGK
jgi:hypothetical protein